MAVCSLLAQLPPSRRQSRDVQPSHHLGQGQAGPYPFQPPGASLSWASVQLTGVVSGSWMCMPGR